MLFAQTTETGRATTLLQFVVDNWLMLLPLALGFAAIYLLMPRARRSWALPGAALGAAGLVIGGLVLVHGDFLLVEGVLFYAFAGIAVVAGGMMITQKNPVHSALSFALVVLASCGLFLLLGAPFLMAATIVVYAGAIVVTFLFVIMLAQQEGFSAADARAREPFLSTTAGFVLVVALIGVLQRNYHNDELDRLVVQLRQVSAARDLDQVRNALNPPADQFGLDIRERFVRYLVAGGSRSLVEDEGADAEHEQLLALADKLELAWNNRDLATLTSEADKLVQVAERLRFRVGSLAPHANLPLSGFSGVPANVPLVIEGGRVKERLPAANVAAVGPAPYSDHLVAVELAGVLLLVATIGAIAIAGRRRDGAAEELR